MTNSRRKTRSRKRRIVNVREREEVLILEPSIVRIRSVRGEGRRVDLEITTEQGKLKVAQRDIDGAPPGVV